MLRRLLITAVLALAAVGTAAVPATASPSHDTAAAITAAALCPYDGVHPQIQQGSTQQEVVRHLQCLLRKVWGYTSVVIDSSFGPATRSAVIAHQRDCGIVPDGIVGPATWSRLHPDTTTPACLD